jgi:hypothetical protein
MTVQANFGTEGRKLLVEANLGTGGHVTRIQDTRKSQFRMLYKSKSYIRYRMPFKKNKSYFRYKGPANIGTRGLPTSVQAILNLRSCACGINRENTTILRT